MNLCCFLQCFYVHLSFILILAVLRSSLSVGQPFHMYLCSIWDLFKKQQQQQRRHRNGMFSIAKENMVASEGNWNE